MYILGQYCTRTCDAAAAAAAYNGLRAMVYMDTQKHKINYAKQYAHEQTTVAGNTTQNMHNRREVTA